MQGPEDVVIEFGKDAIFSCTASGEPEPEIVWFRDSVAIPLDSTRYEVMNNGSLMVHNADETDVGVFECMAKNPTGKVHSRPARMMMQVHPQENGISFGSFNPMAEELYILRICMCMFVCLFYRHHL